MAKKVYEIEVNNENLTNTAKSKSSEVKKSVAEQTVETFGVVEINNASSAKKVSKKTDAGYEKNVTTAKKRQIKAQISEVEDYTDFCFRKTAQPVKTVEVEEEIDLLEYIKEVLAVNMVENNDVKKKIATPSKSGDNDGLIEYYCKSLQTPFYGAEIDNDELLNYIREIVSFSVGPRDDVEAKILKPSVSSENDGLAEYYYTKVVGDTYVKDDDYYDIIEYIKEVLNYTAQVDAEIKEIIDAQDKVSAKKTATKKAPAKKTTKTVAKKCAKKAKAEVVETAVYTADVIKDTYELSTSEEVEEILCVARLGALFDLEKSMLN